MYPLLWCYPQHKLKQFHSTQKSGAERFQNACRKVWATRYATMKREMFTTSGKNYIFKMFFSSAMLVMFDIVDICFRYSWSDGACF